MGQRRFQARTLPHTSLWVFFSLTLAHPSVISFPHTPLCFPPHLHPRLPPFFSLCFPHANFLWLLLDFSWSCLTTLETAFVTPSIPLLQYSLCWILLALHKPANYWNPLLSSIVHFPIGPASPARLIFRKLPIRIGPGDLPLMFFRQIIGFGNQTERCLKVKKSCRSCLLNLDWIFRNS